MAERATCCVLFFSLKSLFLLLPLPLLSRSRCSFSEIPLRSRCCVIAWSRGRESWLLQGRDRVRERRGAKVGNTAGSDGRGPVAHPLDLRMRQNVMAMREARTRTRAPHGTPTMSASLA